MPAARLALYQKGIEIWIAPNADDLYVISLSIKLSKSYHLMDLISNLYIQDKHLFISYHIFPSQSLSRS